MKDSEDKVIPFTGITYLDFPPNTILKKAQKQDLSEVIITITDRVFYETLVYASKQLALRYSVQDIQCVAMQNKREITLFEAAVLANMHCTGLLVLCLVDLLESFPILPTT